jgi:hypothetical protein
MNWTNDYHEDLQLESIWSNDKEWKRNFRREELNLIAIDEENFSCTMYFSWPEFVFAGTVMTPSDQ